MDLNNTIYRDGKAIAAFRWSSDATDYAENESYGYDNGLIVIDDNGRRFHYVAGEIV